MCTGYLLVSPPFTCQFLVCVSVFFFFSTSLSSSLGESENVVPTSVTCFGLVAMINHRQIVKEIRKLSHFHCTSRAIIEFQLLLLLSALCMNLCMQRASVCVCCSCCLNLRKFIKVTIIYNSLRLPCANLQFAISGEGSSSKTGE